MLVTHTLLLVVAQVGAFLIVDEFPSAGWDADEQNFCNVYPSIV